MILILISIIIYQNNTKTERIKDRTQNLFSQKIEKCEDKEIVEKIIIDTPIDENQLTDQEAVSKTKNSLKLSRVDKNGVSIIWSINTDENIKLIATMSKNDIKDKKIFNFNISKSLNQDKVNDISKTLTADFIKVDNESLDKVTSNLNLPEIGIDGSKIIWKSDNQNVITNKGIVMRPSFNEDMVTVTLTAIIIDKNGEEEEKEFDITVEPDESEIRETK